MILLCAGALLSQAQNQQPVPPPFATESKASQAQQQNYSPQLLEQLTSIKAAAMTDDYAYRQLVMANLKKDPAPAREVIKILRELGTAWQQVAAQQRQTKTVGVGRPQMARAV